MFPVAFNCSLVTPISHLTSLLWILPFRLMFRQTFPVHYLLIISNGVVRNTRLTLYAQTPFVRFVVDLLWIAQQYWKAYACGCFSRWILLFVVVDIYYTFVLWCRFCSNGSYGHLEWQFAVIACLVITHVYLVTRVFLLHTLSYWYGLDRRHLSNLP